MTVNATTTDNWSNPMKHVSTGAGLCALAAAVAGFPIINGLASTERTAQASPSVAGTIAAAAMTQAEPTIVWYQSMALPVVGNSSSGYFGGNGFWLVRAWSDGRVEARFVYTGFSQGDTSASWHTQLASCTASGNPWCVGPWVLINDPAAGLAVKADINSDRFVDGKDLAFLLSSWGDAPPLGVPPSDCPLNLINP